MARELSRRTDGERDTQYMFGKGQRYCSKELGELIGAQIWRKWHMPFGWDENQTYRIFFSNYHALNAARSEHGQMEYHGRCVQIFEEMLKLNPDIAGIHDYAKSVPDIIHGMITQFNLDDIRFFVEMRQRGLMPGHDSRKNPEYAKLDRMAETKITRLFPYGMRGERRMVGGNIQWVASIPTLKKIIARLNQIEKEKRK